MTDEYHKSKIAVMKAVSDVYARHGFHGDGTFIEIKVNFLVVTVDVRKLGDGGQTISKADFSVYLQSGTSETCYYIAQTCMEQALRKIGFEFVTMREARGDVE